MKRIGSLRQKETHKLVVMGALLVGACLLTWYFHVAREQGTVFTHLFYIPIILACVWWKKKGYIVAAALAGMLLLSHVLLRSGTPTGNDYLRALMFMIVTTAVIILRDRIDKVEKVLRESRDRLACEVAERKQTEDVLRKSMEQLERFNRLAVGREHRMIELKGEVNELAQQAGLAPPYKSSDQRRADSVASVASQSLTSVEG